MQGKLHVYNAMNVQFDIDLLFEECSWLLLSKRATTESAGIEKRGGRRGAARRGRCYVGAIGCRACFEWWCMFPAFNII